MKILVWGINYDPEPTGIAPFNTDLCEFLADRAHEVTAVTTFAYYPWWKKQPADEGKLFQRCERRGVRVQRCWHYVPRQPSTFKRLLHELSFVTTSTWRALWLKRPDVIVMISPPLFLGLGVYVVSRLKNIPCAVHVQDLQPDAALSLGMIKPGPAVRALYILEWWNYRMARLVTGISEGMLAAYRSKGVPEEKLAMFPNWIPDAQVAEDNATSFRTEYKIPADQPLIAYSGNVGIKQGLEVIVEAALLDERAEGVDMHWAICGEGAARASLEQMIAERGARGVHLYGLQDDDHYRALLREADISLVTQQRGTGQFFFPSKLLSILQYGRPVLAVADADSELARVVNNQGIGRVVEPGDAAALLAAAREMLGAGEEQRADWARRGRHWVEQFKRSTVLAAYERRLAKIIAQQAVAYGNA